MYRILLLALLVTGASQVIAMENVERAEEGRTRGSLVTVAESYSDSEESDDEECVPAHIQVEQFRQARKEEVEQVKLKQAQDAIEALAAGKEAPRKLASFAANLALQAAKETQKKTTPFEETARRVRAKRSGSGIAKILKRLHKQDRESAVKHFHQRRQSCIDTLETQSQEAEIPLQTPVSAPAAPESQASASTLTFCLDTPSQDADPKEAVRRLEEQLEALKLRLAKADAPSVEKHTGFAFPKLDRPAARTLEKLQLGQ